jgi:hypothetical protein
MIGSGAHHLLLGVAGLLLAERQQLHNAAAAVAPGAPAALHVSDRRRVRIVAHHQVHLLACLAYLSMRLPDLFIMLGNDFCNSMPSCPNEQVWCLTCLQST